MSTNFILKSHIRQNYSKTSKACACLKNIVHMRQMEIPLKMLRAKFNEPSKPSSKFKCKEISAL